MTLVGIGSPAQAATSPAPAAQSCSLAADTGQLVCVPVGQDLNAAVLKQTGLRVVTPGKYSLAPAAETPYSTQATVVVAQLFADQGYGGAMFQITGSSGCNVSTITYSVSDLAAFGFDNKTDSFKSFSGCTTRIWESPNFGNASYGYYANATSVGALHDLASSVKVT